MRDMFRCGCDDKQRMYKCNNEYKCVHEMFVSVHFEYKDVSIEKSQKLLKALEALKNSELQNAPSDIQLDYDSGDDSPPPCA